MSTVESQACSLAHTCQQRPPAAAPVRQGDEAALRKLLASSGRVLAHGVATGLAYLLAHVVDENRRRWDLGTNQSE